VEQQPVFSISPDKLLLGPKDTASFLISGISQAAGTQSCSAVGVIGMKCILCITSCHALE
jgi:hypothetical protein